MPSRTSPSFTGQSGFIVLTPANLPTDVGPIAFGAVDPIPVSLTVSSSFSQLTTRGQTAQLLVNALLPDGSLKDVTAQSQGTFYATSNPRIATVGADGLVTALARGRAIISARNEGVIGSATIDILVPNDADGDAMTDEYER
ncbi:MAG: hypothetical protein DMF81_20850, partial [Acidobacteria bacterium]